MKVQAEISAQGLYDSKTVQQFGSFFGMGKVSVHTGAANIRITGDVHDVFSCLRQGFEHLAENDTPILVCRITKIDEDVREQQDVSGMLRQIQEMLTEPDSVNRTPRVLPAAMRSLVALAAAIAYQRGTSEIETCVQQALANGAGPDAIMQVTSQATQMAELSAEEYESAARRAIKAFQRANEET